MITSLDAKVTDLNSEALGVSIETLMHNAGAAIAELISDKNCGRDILIVCGPGNNGGDGLAAAELLGNATVAIFSEPHTDAAKKLFSKLSNKIIKFEDANIDDFKVIIDCALGTGMHGNLRPAYEKYVDIVNSSGKTVISCDVPTGFGTSVCIKPNSTITFGDLKEGMNESNCGTIFINSIGIPNDAFKFVGPGDMLRYPVPKKNSHKGQNGTILIIGGGPYIGAPAIAGMAALRIGADLVHIATPESSFIPVSTFSPSFIMHKLHGDLLSPEDVAFLLKLSEDTDSVLIGPGLGRDLKTQESVIDFVKKCTKPMVLDADGLNAISSHQVDFKTSVIFTPHHAEMERLLHDRPTDRLVESFAKDNNVTIVLKGETDMITDGRHTRFNKTGTPAMTVGGTGDALAGAVACLLAKGMSAFDAGCLGAYICGKAGEKAFKKFSYGMTAPDMITAIAKVLKDGIQDDR